MEQLLKNRIKAELELGDAIEELDEEIESRLGDLLAKKNLTLKVVVNGRKIEIQVYGDAIEKMRPGRKTRSRSGLFISDIVGWSEHGKFKYIVFYNTSDDLNSGSLGETIREAFYGKD